MRLEDINLLDRDVFAGGVPHAWFTFLRQNHPIYRHPEPRGPGLLGAVEACRRAGHIPGSGHLLVEPRLPARGNGVTGSR